MHYPLPQNEPERLAKLLEYEVLDSLPEQSYDDLTAIAAHICGTPIALVSLLDSDRQWFKSRHGIDIVETPREQAFCNYTITQPDAMLVVPDALQDERFQENPLVLENPSIRFYAGTSLISPEGMPLGTLCVIDHTPRELTSQQREVLCALGRQVMAQLELRRKATQLQQEKQALQQALQQLKLTQSSLIEAEKTSAIGNLVIDITQRLSNPLTFIHGNLAIGKDYAEQLLELVSLYRAGSTNLSTIDNFIQNIDLDFISEDLPNLFTSMQNGMNQVNRTVTSLRLFVSDGEAGKKLINIHENLDAVCHLLNSRLQEVATRSTVALVKKYNEIPYITCYPQLLNQALMYLIDHAISAVSQGVGHKHPTGTEPQVLIETSQLPDNHIKIAILDNSEGISEQNFPAIFTPSYTSEKMNTRLVTSHKIISEEHDGRLECQSQKGLGTEMRIILPIAFK